MFSLSNAILALLATSVGVSYAVTPISVNGPNFVNTDGKRVKIVGVDYQPGGQSGFIPESGIDPLSNGTQCVRDAALMQNLGINTVRVYNLDPTINHDACMSTFNDAGMYLILDVNSPDQSLDRSDPGSTYTADYLTRVFGIIENFKDYPNTAGFFAANEVMNNLGTAKQGPPFIRAVIRDMNNYMAKHANRKIPVGYSAADVRPILESTWQYFQCSLGDNDPSQSSLFGLNSYSWCGHSNPQKSGYDILDKMFKPSSIPVFFSEYGCNDISPRPFTEIQAIYGQTMSSLSGGLAYQWTQDVSNFGLVTVQGDDNIVLRQDYDNLKGQYDQLSSESLAAGTPVGMSNTAPKCNPSLITNKAFANSWKLPPPPPGAQALIDNGISSSKFHAGKLIKVSQTSVDLSATDVNGKKYSPLSINVLPNNAVNTPGGSELTSGNGSTTSSGGGSSHTSNPAVALRAMGEHAAASSGLLTLLVALFSLY